MASPFHYGNPSHGQIPPQHMYADASQAQSNVPQSHHGFPPQHFYPDPRAHQLHAAAAVQAPSAQSPLQSHGFLPFDNQHQQHAQLQLQPQMQPSHFGGYYTGYGESGSTGSTGSMGSMPPPPTSNVGTMVGMNSFGATTMQQGMPYQQRTPQQPYQAQMRQSKVTRHRASLAHAAFFFVH